MLKIDQMVAMLSDPENSMSYKDIMKALGSKFIKSIKHALDTDPDRRARLLSVIYPALNVEGNGELMEDDNCTNFICAIGANPKSPAEALKLAQDCPGAFWSLISEMGPGAPDSQLMQPKLISFFEIGAYPPDSGEYVFINKASAIMRDFYNEHLDAGEIDEADEMVLVALCVPEESEEEEEEEKEEE